MATTAAIKSSNVPVWNWYSMRSPRFPFVQVGPEFTPNIQNTSMAIL
jgi:hypothetical protein